mgnify:CR=1 FL=1
MRGFGAFENAMLAALVWGISPIFEKLALKDADPLACLLWRVLGTALGGLFLLPFIPRPGEAMAAVGLRGAALVVTAGALASVLGQVFMYSALKHGEASRVSPVAGSWPLIVFVLAWVFLREPFTARKAAGCAFVVFGVWLLRVP